MRLTVTIFLLVILVLAAPAHASQATPLPAFTVENLSSRDLNSGTAILNIFASWCVPCAAEMPALMKLSRKIPVYGIAYRDSAGTVMPWLEKNGNSFKKIGYDTGGMDTKPLNLFGVPTTFIIRKGKIIYRLDGPMGPAQEKEIRAAAGIAE